MHVEIADVPRRRFAPRLGSPMRWGLRPLAVGCWLALFHTLARGAAPEATTLAWRAEDGVRLAPLTVPQAGRAGFSHVLPAATGIVFTNLLADARSATNRNLLSGSGVAAGDIDGDGWCDLYFCGLDSDNALYRNLGGWKFADVTADAGVACPGQDSTGAAFADFDGDGDLDLIVTGLGHGVRLFVNDGRGRFQETTSNAGLGSRTGSMSCAIADVDGDGDLDLYVANFRPTTIKDRITTRFRIQTVNDKPVVAAVDGRPTSLPELANRFVYTPSGNVIEFGEVDVLFFNDGGGRFRAASFLDGTFRDEAGERLKEPPRDWGLAAMFYDFTGDGAPDLYVCNDLFTPDRIWINTGRGTFRALSTHALRNTSTFSMGVDFADIDRDGDADFFVVDMLSRDSRNQKLQVTESRPSGWPIGVIDDRPQLWRNTLQLNRGDGSFAEISYYAGVEASEWSWAPIFLDVDLDGYEDILVSNGQLRDFQNADMAEEIEHARAGGRATSAQMLEWMRRYEGLYTPNAAFRNRGDLTFEETGKRWGFDTPGISQGMALADLDNDGDVDVVMNNLNAAAGVYRNESNAPRILVRLRGQAPNTRGIGARIQISGGPGFQTQEMLAGGRYLSGDDPARMFAAGHATNELRIEVTWRNGKRSRVAAARANHVYELIEPDAGAATPAGAPAAPPGEAPAAAAAVLFEDASARLNHTHHEEFFDDLERQPLLPRRFSQLGPGVGWADLNLDGWEDLFVGSGRGGQIGVFLNDRTGGFQRLAEAPFNQSVTRDVTTILAGPRMTTAPTNAPALLAGLSNYEDGLPAGACARAYVWDRARPRIEDALPGTAGSTGPLALSDIDGDGDLDLFLGGRLMPGRYPEPVASFIFINDQGRLRLDPENSSALAHLGLVSGAVFSDLDDDGRADLILASDWGPVRVFRNDMGRLREVTQALGLDPFQGWWNGVTTGDFDGDGRMDIAASNWGLNSRHRASPDTPCRLHFGDFDDNGTLDVIEARLDPALGREMPERGLLPTSASMPFVREQFRTHKAYAAADVAELLGDRPQRARVLQVTTLRSTVFLNRGPRFEARPLPAEAQWTPAFATVVADFDGDGREDLFLSQNLFATQPQEYRYDAGRGLLLRGEGDGEFAAVPANQSGIAIHGEQRGAAAADYDRDGRADLVVTQNGAATRLYHNRGARPGLRVRLQGPAANPTAVGARLWLEAQGRRGPAREIHAGSGYWSQDSAIQVLADLEPPMTLVVRWPGGRRTTSPVPPGSREVTVDAPGKLASAP